MKKLIVPTTTRHIVQNHFICQKCLRHLAFQLQPSHHQLSHIMLAEARGCLPIMLGYYLGNKCHSSQETPLLSETPHRKALSSNISELVPGTCSCHCRSLSRDLGFLHWCLGTLVTQRYHLWRPSCFLNCMKETAQNCSLSSTYMHYEILATTGLRCSFRLRGVILRRYYV